MKKILSAFAVLLALTGCNSSEPKAEATATTDGKAIVECIMTRTSIRQYTDQTVSADTIETLLRAGMAAPTAVNKNPGTSLPSPIARNWTASPLPTPTQEWQRRLRSPLSFAAI